MVLRDYIRKEFLDMPEVSLETLTQLGVIPNVKYLTVHKIYGQYLAVLTGSLVVFSKPAMKGLEELLKQ